eukprot:jgi/Mesvir1/11337/Mv26030-RA.1
MRDACFQLPGILRLSWHGLCPQERFPLKPSSSKLSASGRWRASAMLIKCYSGSENEGILKKMQGSLGMTGQASSLFYLKGTGKMLGLSSSWDLWHAPAGGFVEKGAIRVPDNTGKSLLLPFGGGHLPGNAGRESDTWQVDLYGVPRSLHLEDRELLLLAAWFRTCQWLSPHVLPRLEVGVEGEGLEGVDGGAAGGTSPPRPTSSPADWWAAFTHDPRFQQSIARLATASGDGKRSWLRVWMRLRDGCVPACVTVCCDTWRPQGMALLTCAGWDTWHLSAWHDVQGEASPASSLGETRPRMLPHNVVHSLAAGGSNHYAIQSVQVEGDSTCVHDAGDAPGEDAGSRRRPSGATPNLPVAAGAVDRSRGEEHHRGEERRDPSRGGGSPPRSMSPNVAATTPTHLFACPPIPRVPEHASFGPPGDAVPMDESARAGAPPAGADASVPAMRSQGGHVLVRPRVDGRDVGWFILDPSTSGLAITPQVADALQLPAFGEQHLNGLGGAIITRLHRSSSLQLGALTLQGPLFTSMALDGAVRGPEAVAGVIGGDVCRCAVIEVKSEPRAPGSPTPGKLSVWVHDPRTYDPPARVAVGWQKLWFIADQPHVIAGFSLDDRAEDGEAGPSVEADRNTLDPACLPHSHVGFSDDTGLFKLSLGVGGVGAIFGTRVVQGLGILDRCFLLPPSSGMVSGAGGSQARWQDVSSGDNGRGKHQQEPSVATFRLPSLEFVGANFKYIRTLVHVGTQPNRGAASGNDSARSNMSSPPAGEDPADLELSVYADGAVCAEILRECHLVLDVGGGRLSFSNVQRPPSQFGKTGKFF